MKLRCQRAVRCDRGRACMRGCLLANSGTGHSDTQACMHACSVRTQHWPGMVGQARRARHDGPDTAGQARWARHDGPGTMGQARWARHGGPGTADLAGSREATGRLGHGQALGSRQAGRSRSQAWSQACSQAGPTAPVVRRLVCVSSSGAVAFAGASDTQTY